MPVPEAFREAVEKAMAEPAAPATCGCSRGRSTTSTGPRRASTWRPAPSSRPTPAALPARCCSSRGHMIDAPDRTQPRFPAGQGGGRPAGHPPRRSHADAADPGAGPAGHRRRRQRRRHPLPRIVRGDAASKPTSTWRCRPEKFLEPRCVRPAATGKRATAASLARGPVFVLGESEDGAQLARRQSQWQGLQRVDAQQPLDAAQRLRRRRRRRDSIVALWNRQEGDGAGGTGDLVNEALERGAAAAHLRHPGALRALTISGCSSSPVGFTRLRRDEVSRSPKRAHDEPFPCIHTSPKRPPASAAGPRFSRWRSA